MTTCKYPSPLLWRKPRALAYWVSLFLTLGSAVLFVLVQTESASGAAGDEHWSAQFGVPGTPNLMAVQALGWNRSRFYATGVNGGITTNCPLMVYDGHQWSQVAEFRGSVVQILSIAFVGEDMYVGGMFTNVNGVAARSVARWNGSAWSDLGLDGYVIGMAANGTDLYVAGAFTGAGGVMMTNIGRWDGSAWHALGPGLGKPGELARAIAIGEGKVYVGGKFTCSGAEALTNVAVWNGGSWAPVDGGVTGTSSSVNTVAWQAGNLYVGGPFTMAGGIAVANIARWDGDNWWPMGSGLNGQPYSISFLSNTVCVAGNFSAAGGAGATNFAIWNGSAWAGSGLGLSASAICSVGTGTNVYVGGTFTIANGGIAYYVASWDGTRFNPVGPRGMLEGMTSSVRALAHDGTHLYAGGSFGYAGSTNATRVARFNGTNWSSLGSGLNNTVRALAVVGTNIYAGGSFTGGAGGPSASHLARWNGANWVPLTNFSSTVVNALATRGNDLYIAGYFMYNAADGMANWLARWDGTNMWNVLVFPPDTPYMFYVDNIGFTALAVDGPNVYVSGRCAVSSCDASFNCTNSQNVMWFDGTYVRGLGTGLSSNANAITVMGTNVYFGGPFTNAGGVTARGIARWNGRSWSDVGGGIVGNGTIYALVVAGTNLYAGGSFTNIGGVPANRIARWNGSTWSALGSGTVFDLTDGPVFRLLSVSDDLYAGGTFVSAGGKRSYHIARWNEKLDFSNTELWLEQPRLTSAGNFQFTVTALGVPTYIIDTALGLGGWVPALTNSTTPYDYTDFGTRTNGRRFYRVRSQP